MFVWLYGCLNGCFCLFVIDCYLVCVVGRLCVCDCVCCVCFCLVVFFWGGVTVFCVCALACLMGCLLICLFCMVACLFVCVPVRLFVWSFACLCVCV